MKIEKVSSSISFGNREKLSISNYISIRSLYDKSRMFKLAFPNKNSSSVYTHIKHLAYLALNVIVSPRVSQSAVA